MKSEDRTRKTFGSMVTNLNWVRLMIGKIYVLLWGDLSVPKVD